MSLSSINAPERCANCSKITGRPCTGCKDAPILPGCVPPAYYCNQACENAHFKVHKGDCQLHEARGILYRAGRILQDIFYLYRERLFDLGLARIEKRDARRGSKRISKLYLYERVPTDQSIRSAITSQKDVKALLEETSVTVEDRKFVLAHGGDEIAIANMHEITKCMLEGIVSSISEVTFIATIPSQERTIIMADGRTRESSEHTIWVVGLGDSNEQHALDVTSAQLGAYEPVTPWAQYQEVHSSESATQPVFEQFGSLLALQKDILHGTEGIEQENLAAALEFRYELSERILAVIRDRTRLGYCSMENIFRASNQVKFEKKRNSFMCVVEDCLKQPPAE